MKDPLGTPGHSGTAWGHLCHCWSITEPPALGHRLMELNAREVTQQGTCPASAGPGDPSAQGCSQCAGGCCPWCPHLPRAQGLLASCPHNH